MLSSDPAHACCASSSSSSFIILSYVRKLNPFTIICHSLALALCSSLPSNDFISCSSSSTILYHLSGSSSMTSLEDMMKKVNYNRINRLSVNVVQVENL